MEAVVIKTSTKSDIRFLMDWAKRIGMPAKTVDTEKMADTHFVSLIEKGLKTKSISRDEVMSALKP